MNGLPGSLSGYRQDATAGLLARHGPAAAAVVAAIAGLPGLRLPFLADDWADLAMAAGAPAARTPFGYFRPLCMATYSIERRAWGISPSLSHLTNLILIAAVAALVVIAIRHYTGDAFLAAAAGVLFALHPCHVENAAWIAARADPLFSLFFIMAALSYDRWRAYDIEDSLRFYALRLYEVGMIKTTPQKIIAQGLDLRIVNELKRELKA